MKVPKSTWLPIVLFIYLCVMAFIGRSELLVKKNYLFYFSTFFITLACIIVLHFFLKKQEQKRKNKQ